VYTKILLLLLFVSRLLLLLDFGPSSSSSSSSSSIDRTKDILLLTFSQNLCFCGSFFRNNFLKKNESRRRLFRPIGRTHDDDDVLVVVCFFQTQNNNCPILSNPVLFNPHYRSLNTHRSNTHTFQTGWCSLGSSSPLLCKRPEAPFLVGREDEEGWWFLPSKGKERRERRRRIRRRRDVLRGGVPSVTSGPERSVERPERGAIRV